MAAKARNERVIEDLLKIPGNEICADCRGSGPRWCSWNIGILLCVPCASQHRRLGTHISKVKSLTLDVFTREQIESIRSMGNIKSNALINNDDRTNPPPTSWEDSARESELERYIRRKYTSHPKPIRSPSPPPLPTRTTNTSRTAPPSSFPTTFEDTSSSSAPIRAPSRAKSTPLPAPTVEERKTPIFGSTLEHRPAGGPVGHPGGVEPMRRGRPGSAMNNPSNGSGGEAAQQQQQQQPHQNGQQQFASSAYPQQQQPPLQYLSPQQQQQASSSFQPQFQPQQQQQQQIPQHGAWGDLMSLSSGQPLPPPQQPPQQSFYQPQSQPQFTPSPSSFQPQPQQPTQTSSFQQPQNRSGSMPTAPSPYAPTTPSLVGASQYFGGMATIPQQQPMTSSPYQQFGHASSFPFQSQPQLQPQPTAQQPQYQQQQQQQFAQPQQQQPNYGQGGGQQQFGGGGVQQQPQQPQQAVFNTPNAFFGSMMPGQGQVQQNGGVGGGQSWGGR